jgi:hypothetical protein
MSDQKKKTKLFLLISNAVVALVCIVAMTGFFVMPAAKMRVSVKIDRPLLESLREDVKKRGGSEGEDNGIGPDVIIDSLIEEIGEGSVVLYGGISVTTPGLLRSIGASHKQAFVNLLEENSDSIVNDVVTQLENSRQLLINTMTRFIKKASSAAIQNNFEDIKNTIKERAGSAWPQEFDDFCERSGMDDETMQELSSGIIEGLSTDGMTSDEIADEAKGIYVTVYDRAKTDPKYGGDFLDKYEYDPDGFRNSVKEMLDESGLQDENGLFSMDFLADQIIMSGILDMLPGTEIVEGAIQDELSAMSVLPQPSVSLDVFGHLTGISSASSTSVAPAKDNSEIINRLKEKLSGYIRGLADNKDMNDVFFSVHIIMISLALTILIHMIAWLYLLIKLFVKSFRPNPGATLWVPVAFGWSFISFITLIPRIRMNYGLLKLIPGVGEELSKGTYPELTFRFATSGIIAAICGVALFIFGFVYAHQRRKYKAMLSGSSGREQA